MTEKILPLAAAALLFVGCDMAGHMRQVAIHEADARAASDRLARTVTAEVEAVESGPDGRCLVTIRFDNPNPRPATVAYGLRLLDSEGELAGVVPDREIASIVGERIEVVEIAPIDRIGQAAIAAAEIDCQARFDEVVATAPVPVRAPAPARAPPEEGGGADPGDQGDRGSGR